MRKTISILFFAVFSLCIIPAEPLTDILNNLQENEILEENREIREHADSIISAIINEDYETLAENCEDTIRMNLYFGFSEKYDTLIAASEIRNADDKEKEFLWYEYQPADYFSYSLQTILKSYINHYDRMSVVGINQLNELNDGTDTEWLKNNTFSVFGDCFFIEYFMEPAEHQIDWKSIIIVMRKSDGKYKLCGITSHSWEL